MFRFGVWMALFYLGLLELVVYFDLNLRFV